ncbi:Uncharacterized conserved protein, DUF58 family, contains vWF domain [Acetitomaculum ruminis DSM 5522]|uniref:Uncharacterized conserved protein, DUF58 family, contains vWF domain n=1 Tax=Acetitomaculum ruminis DSM 5522 TaxID=1120918 RepID=A0A1I0W6W1_9FIRM|nr:DUF58 domain-containing protein [Acetitomaculum ruminis]SFA84422.1 Uncharacterized conserved protein, DUF58 family, contains vWF domain [Acetitomaculum ruminis DSM 5522]
MLKNRISYGIYLVVLILIYIFSDYSLAFYLLLVSVLVGILGIVQAYLVRKSLSAAFEFKGNVKKNTKSKGKITFKNSSILPVCKAWIKLDFKNALTSQKSSKVLMVSINSKSNTEVVLDFSSIYCGNIELSIDYIKTLDILGLVAFKNTCQMKKRVSVIPNLVEGRADLFDRGTYDVESVDYSPYQKGDDPGEVFDIREYAEGDPIKNIHWKLTGKYDELFVKELSFPVENSLLLFYETSLLNGHKIKAEVLDNMMETLVATSLQLSEEGVVHFIGWYDQESFSYRQERVADSDSLAESLNALLSISQRDNDESGLAYYLENFGEHPFANVLYVTSDQEGDVDFGDEELCNISPIICKGA